MIHADEKLPAMNYRIDVRDKEYYDILVGSGFAWEFYPDLPLSWQEVEKQLEYEVLESGRIENESN